MYIHCFSYDILLTEFYFIKCLIALTEILDNICIAIACSPGCDVISVDLTTKSRQQFKSLDNGKSFQDEIKSVVHFIILKWLSVF